MWQTVTNSWLQTNFSIILYFLVLKRVSYLNKPVPYYCSIKLVCISLYNSGRATVLMFENEIVYLFSLITLKNIKIVNSKTIHGTLWRRDTKRASDRSMTSEATCCEPFIFSTTLAFSREQYSDGRLKYNSRWYCVLTIFISYDTKRLF